MKITQEVEKEFKSKVKKIKKPKYIKLFLSESDGDKMMFFVVSNKKSNLPHSYKIPDYGRHIYYNKKGDVVEENLFGVSRYIKEAISDYIRKSIV